MTSTKLASFTLLKTFCQSVSSKLTHRRNRFFYIKKQSLTDSHKNPLFRLTKFVSAFGRGLVHEGEVDSRGWAGGLKWIAQSAGGVMTSTL